jgi:predicted RNase H-like nuclease (RuvC/YqgF family)
VAGSATNLGVTEFTNLSGRGAIPIDIIEPGSRATALQMRIVMSSRELNEIASNLDEASTVVEELRDDRDVDTRAKKLDELQKTLEDASDRIDELSDQDQ